MEFKTVSQWLATNCATTKGAVQAFVATPHTVEPYYWAMDIGTANLKKKKKYSYNIDTAILMVFLES